MAEVVQGVVNHGMDTNVLFEKYTIDEIREIEKKTRTDIERKKEELRVMVGERYRDLIEAADTITEMKHSAENVSQSITVMQELCGKMKQDHMVKGFNIIPKPKHDDAKRREQNQFYGIAVQTKLLLDMPEKIWSALDSKEYLRATQMYLLARHTHAGLQTGLIGTQSTRLLSSLPVLARTWSTISQFRDVILKSCRDMLRVETIGDEDAAQCLCSLLLLEDSTPRQVFNDFLILSTSAVQHLFTADQSSMSIRDQVCSVVQVIVRTIHQIYAVFSSNTTSADPNVPSNLLMSTLAKVTDKGDTGKILKDVNGSASIKFLPNAVQDFRPALRNHATPIADKNLQENCQQWVKSCMQTVQAGLTELLGYVTSVRGLAAIRTKVWEQLAADPRTATWSTVCTATLHRNVNIWDEFFQKHFLSRTKELLKAQYDTALSSCKQQVTRVLTDLATADKAITVERDVSGYVWVESATDMPSNMAWVTVGSKTLADTGTLSMKAKAYTPAIQSLCRGFDGKLRTLVEDAGHYLKPGAVETKGPFDLYADTPVILAFLQESCETCIIQLLEFLQHELSAYKEQLASGAESNQKLLTLDKLLLLGRLSAALCELSVHFQQCMMGTAEKIEPPKIGRRAVGIKSAAKSPEDPKWAAIKNKLHDFSNEAFGCWAEHTSDQLSREYKEALLDQNGTSILRASTRWGEIDIEEETEDGKKMTSKIRVPMQPSSYVTSLLYMLCQKVNRIGGHTINRGVLTQLVQRLSDDIIGSYEELNKRPKKPSTTEGREQNANLAMNQTHALQLCFDVRLLGNVLPRKDDTKENKEYQQRLQKVVDKLETHIDPFDLDVFMPYMNTNITRQSQRFSVLLGTLMSLDKHGTYMGSRPAMSSHQEQHNMLTLSSSQSRLPLLPLSVQSRTSSMAPPIMQPPKPKLPTEAPEEPPVVSMPRNESSGFLANMSTLWFSNVSKK